LTQTNEPTLKADPKVLKIFPHRTFFKTILSLPALAHLVLPNTQTQPFAKPKEPILPPRKKTVEKILTV